ncbi:hypothetical protein BR93DRAFT_877746 [Coniochaeta sp. PMI_546]|nr:hypothetical protein BR93DRAFT_877746 [Coniochaeta sp. PMI_546]
MSASTQPNNSNPPVLAEIYDTKRFGQLLHGSFDPPMQNLGLAARYIVSLFRRHGIPFAFLGGWAIYLRGGLRTNQDVDVTVAGNMDGLKAIMLQEQRLCIPQTHEDTTIKVFVHTGGNWDPRAPDVTLFTVSMDIIIGGHWGMPPDLPNGTEELRPVPSTTQGCQAVPVIDLYCQITSKLSTHYIRRDINGGSDYTDLEFLVRRYPAEISIMRHYLDVEHKRAFFTDFAAENDLNSTRFLSRTLGLSQEDIDAT